MQKNNQKERFEFPHATQGCEWAIAAPIITIVVVALIGAIISSASGIAIEILGANPIYLCIGSALTELSFLIAALSISKFNKVNYLSASGVKVSTPWWTYVGAIVISILVLVLLNPIINCWQVLLDTIGHQSSEIPITVDTVANLFLALTLYALIPAICEEALFRGVILNGLRKYGVLPAVLISASFFALMHMNLVQFPYTFCLGIVFGLVVYYTRNLWLSVIMHFVNNASVLIIGYFTLNIEYTFVWYDILIGIAGLLLCGVLVYFLIKFLNKKFSAKLDQTERPYLETQPVIEKSIRKRMWITPIVLAVACFIISIINGFGVI